MANAEDSDESSTDEDFNPDDADPEAKTGGDEEFDSDAADRSTDSEDRGVSICFLLGSSFIRVSFYHVDSER